MVMNCGFEAQHYLWIAGLRPSIMVMNRGLKALQYLVEFIVCV